MKLRHKTHGWVPDRTDPRWAERVEREAAVTTDQAEHAHAKAQERLARAEHRLAQESSRRKPDRKRLKRLAQAVENRRAELRRLSNLARTTSAPSTSRGQKSHRGIARGDVL